MGIGGDSQGKSLVTPHDAGGPYLESLWGLWGESSIKYFGSCEH